MVRLAEAGTGNQQHPVLPGQAAAGPNDVRLVEKLDKRGNPAGGRGEPDQLRYPIGPLPQQAQIGTGVRTLDRNNLVGVPDGTVARCSE